MEIERDYRRENQYLDAARRLETEARNEDFGTFLILTMLAADFRLRAIGLVGDPSDWMEEGPPFTCGFGSCRG